MHRYTFVFLLSLLIPSAGWCVEPGQSASHIAYVYPAGAKQGSSLEITAGGQGLRNIQEVYVSGTGVKAKALRTIPNFKKTYGDYLRDYTKKAKTAKAKEDRAARAAKQKRGSKKGTKGGTKEGTKKSEPKKKKESTKEALPPAPDHPIFRDLKKRSLPELVHLQQRFYKENRQRNREMDERALIQVTVDSDAEPGMREMRIRTNQGLSNPIRFYIGDKPEMYEREPNEKQANNPVLEAPLVFNGQIMPGDIDQFRFRAKAGQQLLIQGHARSLIPYLADAVPGWFQAVMTLYDETGEELSYVDDYRFSPDPVLFYQIENDGIYTVQIRDSIFRGREDFVYRITVGEDPFISHLFPLGGRQGQDLTCQLSGWNLPKTKADLSMQGEPGSIHSFALDFSNQVPYAVDEFPEWREADDNHRLARAQKLKWPVMVNGRIEKPGEVDYYQFEGRPGDRVVVEVMARRLNSPLDSKIKVIDESGTVLAWNDDAEQLNLGMQTHHADSKLSLRLPRQGRYAVSVADTQGQGGPEYAYRLRISRPHPDFAVTSTPASLTVRMGCTVPLTVHAVRKDGYDGEIDLVLKDAPKGFHLNGATIPAGQDKVMLTLTAPTDTKNQLFPIRLQGRAKIDRGVVTREVLPGQAMTQAFITHHVVPFEQMMVYVGGWGEVVEVETSKNARVRIPRGGETSLRIKRKKSESRLVLKLYQPPEGITLEQIRSSKNSMSVALKASDKVKAGTSGNLMIEVFREYKAKNNGKVRSSSIGVMPAVPFVVE
ncbi:hypothetical protein HW115_04525 [Verrucomicrobiaceae bacterium N1E253]|uniref:Peptidase C-terminal archaeal/bacterial domain-containing protein n=1 Tax=Oceaniferula marina TaxID=2748318 RepID=A0A851GGB5_9BACT|nr:hypothetical protein [Oceaniferula marina]NWK54861.1 hypothetical protein [Oceaniferula marina]